MSFQQDAELRELFRQELEQRAGELVGGAQKMREGQVTADLAGAMFREGHTIKGTGRVMGFDTISRAGQLLEMVWRRVQHGDLKGDVELGKALEVLAAVLPGALAASDDSPVNQAIAQLNEAVRHASPRPMDPPPAQPVKEVRHVDSVELGGLLGALDTWASEDVARVNAASLYRLINTVASLGVYAEGLHSMVLDLSDAVGANDQVKRLAEAIRTMERTIGVAKDTALALAAAKLKEVTNTFPQLVAYLAKKTGKEIRFELVGDEEAVDRQILERLADALRQLIVNAIEHGIEMPEARLAAGKPRTATLSIRASVKDHRLEVAVEDDGAGVDWEMIHRTAIRRNLLPAQGKAEQDSLQALLFAPGFSTASAPSELVGDGTGLTTVATAIEQLRGSLAFDTELGKGTRVTLVVPTSRALQDAVIVAAAGHHWGIPEAAVADIVVVDDTIVAARRMDWQERPIPVVPFAGAVGLAEILPPTKAVVVRSQMGPVALTVSSVLGQHQVAAKELGPLLSGAPHLTGAALLGDGDVVVLVDPVRLAERARELPYDSRPRSRVLVVDDSQGARQVVAGALASSGFNASVAGSSDEALRLLEEQGVDALVVDFSMPGSDGVALVAEVRRRFGKLPVVMLSGVATPDDQARARAVGVDAYFDKADFREGALVASLQSLVANRRSEAKA